MSPSNFDITFLREAASSLSIDLDSSQLSLFAHYQKLLVEWNQRINLTAITGPRDIQIRHFLDSLTCSRATGNLNGQSLIDVGSGAGFPGVPLKIMYPEMRLTLIESVTKKARFLDTLAAELGLDHVTILSERAETIGRDPDYREQYDWSVARGVAKIAVLEEYLLPLTRVGGTTLAQKGEGAPTAIESVSGAIKRLGGGEPEIHPVNLPGYSQLHYLVVIPKVSPTPDQYPRRPGIPSKRPLE
jgi:16S rRNA (guanine527-N7)-methyltransferase